MRLLIVNPNTSDDVTALIEKEARACASPSTELVFATAPYGFEYIETRFEALVAAAAVAEVIAEHDGTVDGVLVAAFGDPGMPALKEVADVPVVGITEAALCAAALQGRRIAIVAISDRITAWYRDCVEEFGLGSRLVSIRSIREALGAIGTVQDDFGPVLVDLACAAVADDAAEVVILAGAPLAGLARSVVDQVPVPVVDGVAAGVRMLEAVSGLQGGHHRAGSFAPPPVKLRRGLSPGLDRTLERLQKAAG